MSDENRKITCYNGNVYISLLQHLYDQLPSIDQFLRSIKMNNQFRFIDNLTESYNNIFTSELVTQHINFKIERIYESFIFRTPEPLDKGNSSFHITLKLQSEEIIWLDNIYGSILSRLIKFYKHLFSKIDNYSITLNSEQLAKYHHLLSDIKKEIERLLHYTEQRDIVAKRKKLQERHLTNIPFGGLFYIAHLDNIKSILEIGILSHNIAQEKGIVNVDISNQEVNRRRNRIEPNLGNIHDYAPLYINPKNPMLYSLCMNGQREKLILLRINPHILLADNVAFSDGNAAVKTTHFYNNIEDFNKLSWKVINDTYWTNYPDGKRIRCSEVLVKETIPLYYINDLYVYNELTLDKILPLFPNHLGINTSINRKLYF